MVSSSESNDVLVEELNRQLGEAFGASGAGCINIKALHKLLTSLIALHIRYGAEKQQSKLICSSNTNGENVSGNNLDSSTSSGTPGKTVPASEEVTEVTEILEDKDVQKEIDRKSPTPPVQTVSGKEDDALDVTQSEKRLGSKPSSDVLTERSSDFLVKSTSSSEKSVDLNPKESSIPSASSPSRPTPSRSVKSSSKASPKTSTSVPPVEEEKTAGQDNATQTTIEFVSVLEGCKTHLEAVKEEILELKDRLQSQHEDTLKLAGALDNLVYRVGSQEPKVEKLETDNHCLGMLISDYEVNFKAIEKRLERHDVRVQEIERTFQRMDKERDGLRADLRSVGEQTNYLATVKADRVDVQTELNRRALVTDMQQRVPYAAYNEVVRDLSRTITQLREELHDVDQNLKTVQYELVKGLAAKATAQDVTQIRKQLTGALNRWQKIEREQHAAGGGAFMGGDSPSAGVSATAGGANEVSKCLACGIQTTLEGNQTLVSNAFVPVNRIRPGVRNAGGAHTKCVPPEKVFRTGSLGVMKKTGPQDEKRGCEWKL